MNYSEISKKPETIEQMNVQEVAVVPDAPCEECMINYPEDETEVTPELETPKPVFGIVSGCAALNIRDDCSLDGKVVAVVTSGTVLEIDSANCEDDWLAVYTASGIEGFCMAQYVTIKD